MSALPSRRVRRSSTGTASHTSLTRPCVIGSPSWRVMTDPDKVGVPPSDDDLRARAQKAETNVREAVSLVSAAAGVELGGRILEIGCYDGATAFQLALRLGATSSAPTSRATTSCNALADRPTRQSNTSRSPWSSSGSERASPAPRPAR